MKRKSVDSSATAAPSSSSSSSSKKSRRGSGDSGSTAVAKPSGSIHDISNALTTARMAHDNIVANFKHTSSIAKTYYLLGGLAALALGRQMFAARGLHSGAASTFLYAPIHGGKMQGMSSSDLRKDLALSSSSRFTWNNESTDYMIDDTARLTTSGNNATGEAKSFNSGTCSFDLSGISSGDHLNTYFCNGDSITALRTLNNNSSSTNPKNSAVEDASKTTSTRPRRSWLRSQLARQRSRGAFTNLYDQQDGVRTGGDITVGRL